MQGRIQNPEILKKGVLIWLNVVYFIIIPLWSCLQKGGDRKHFFVLNI